MGQRANFVIQENSAYSLFYSHWCANTLTRDLFWGPVHALSFIRVQRPVDESGWLDNVWAEGGAVVDCDNRVLLLFGGEEVHHDVPLRRVYLDTLRRVWTGWDVRWAFEGIADLADYVSYPRARVLVEKRHDHDHQISLTPPEHLEWTDLVGSIRMADGKISLFPLAGSVEDYLFAGINLSKTGQSSHHERVPLDEWLKSEFPSGGFHVDVPERRLDYWVASEIAGIPEKLKEIWPDWTVTWHRDAYEWQRETTEGRLQFPERSVGALQDQLRQMLLHEDRKSMANTILELTEKDRAEGKDVRINPWALRDDRVELSLKERQRIVAMALDSHS